MRLYATGHIVKIYLTVFKVKTLQYKNKLHKQDAINIHRLGVRVRK
jgi:hypothetical protein